MSGWVKVPITGGSTLIDPADLEIMQYLRWHVSDRGYAVWRGIVDGSKKTIRLHRLIARTPDNRVTDHINHDRLDNRRSNLRVVTQSENMRNLTNQGRGYWWHKQNQNWVVEVHGKHVGCFTDESEAARIAALVRAGGSYRKPERTQCKHGHSLSDAYDYGNGILCRRCQSIRSKEYWQRRKLRP